LIGLARSQGEVSEKNYKLSSPRNVKHEICKNILLQVIEISQVRGHVLVTANIRTDLLDRFTEILG
jgi:hypothetical protein